MIYFFTGTDAGKARAKAFQWIAAARTKRPDAPYVRLSPDAITNTSLADAAGAQGLFFSKSLVLLDDPFSEKESGETVLEHLSMLAGSENLIAILAPKLLAARVKKIEGKAAQTFTVDQKEKPPARGFNGALVNALAAKDGPVLWKEIQKAYRLGDAPEAVHGLLSWKARDLMQKGSGKWGKDGARKLSRDLIELLSDSRSGDLPLKESLERFALSL
jgi:hypothetical protein